jgi:hypothetical protein
LKAENEEIITVKCQRISILIGNGLAIPGRRGDADMTVTKTKRDFVFCRDGYKCVTCGTNQDLTIDHIFPKSRGGSDKTHNLQTLCAKCNREKGDSLPEDWETYIELMEADTERSPMSQTNPTPTLTLATGDTVQIYATPDVCRLRITRNAQENDQTSTAFAVTLELTAAESIDIARELMSASQQYVVAMSNAIKQIPSYLIPPQISSEAIQPVPLYGN